MKSIVLVLTLVLAGLSSSTVLADSWHSRDFDHYRGGHHSSRHNSRSIWSTGLRYNSYAGRYYSPFDSRFRSPYRRGHVRGNYVSLSFGDYPSWGHNRRYYGGRHDAGDFIGGLVVGGLLTSALTRDSYRSYSAPVVHTRVVSSPRVITSRVNTPRAVLPANTRTRLLRDLQGNCFEISYAPDGTEQRAQLAPESCTF